MATTITIFIVLFDSKMLRSSPQLAESVFIGKARTQDGGRTSAKKIKIHLMNGFRVRIAKANSHTILRIALNGIMKFMKYEGVIYRAHIPFHFAHTYHMYMLS